MDSESKVERDLSTVVAFSSAVAFGAMLGVLQALRVNKPEISFHFSIWTAMAFLVGATTVCLFATSVHLRNENTSRLSLRWPRRTGPHDCSSAHLPFAVPPVDQLVQRFAGVGTALCFIAAGFTMVYRVVLAAQLDEDRQEAEEKNSSVTNSPPQASFKQTEEYENWGS
jgi:uncharacterized BrkB/YihY/UPF0761 family membrane protein